MELKEFVRSVLANVITGVREAQQIEGVGGFVVPAGIGGHDYPKHPRLHNQARITSTIVDFDIAVTAEDTEATSGRAGLKVAVFGAGISGESASKDVRVSRIQFAVPVLLPESKRQWNVDAQDKNG